MTRDTGGRRQPERSAGSGAERRKPTPPSQAPGEAGDREARRRADEAVRGGSGAGGRSSRSGKDGEGGGRERPADVPATPPPVEPPD
ncbi:hypothetical protein C0216_16855 [Streptomyces globosus]|uniref:Uncharacterized protein n=1 Tax=Streptomyces globosus TaxID=68209 RepID=A0A344U1X8_9ACTN|nr:MULTISPECIES: hypothetical protein [Streptomyces]AXE24899.1 hypothetical protein C0216_16855 [Streptomyces globosus]